MTDFLKEPAHSKTLAIHCSQFQTVRVNLKPILKDAANQVEPSDLEEGLYLTQFAPYAASDSVYYAQRQFLVEPFYCETSIVAANAPHASNSDKCDQRATRLQDLADKVDIPKRNVTTPKRNRVRNVLKKVVKWHMVVSQYAILITLLITLIYSFRIFKQFGKPKASNQTQIWGF